jgi:hypothetical protein
MLSIDMLGGSGVVVNTGVWNAMTYQKNADYTFSGGGTIDHFNATNGGGTISGCPVFENFGGEVITIPEGSAVQTKSASGANTFGNGKLIISGDSVSDGNEVRGNILHLIFSGSGQRLSFSTIQAREVHFVNGSKIITSHSDDFGAEPPTAERFVIHPGSSLKNPEGRHVYILGNIENYGQISDMNLHTIGSIKNNGEWTGGTLGLTGVTPRYITGSNPIMTSVTIFESFPLLNPHVIFGGSFGVTTGKSILFSPDDTFLTDPENDTDTYIVELLGPVSGNIIAEMADGKELDPSDSTEIRISGSAGEQNIQADLSADTIRISGGTKRLYRQTFSGDLIIEPSASLFNWKSNWSELTHFGDIVNKGSIIGESNGYAFYMDLYGDAENQGIWRNAKVRLKGNEDRLLDGVFDSDVSIGSEEFVITGYPVFAKNLSVSNHLLVGKNDDETDAALTFTGNNTFSDIDVRGADETVSAILIFAGSSQGFDNEIHADTIVFASPISSSSSTKTMYSPKLYGDVFVEEGVVVQDYSSSYARMMVYGDIHNNGIIRNRTSGGDSYWWQLYAENDGNIFTGKNAEWRSERIVAYWNNKEKGTYQYAFTQDPEKVKSHDPQDWEKFENTKYASLSVKDEVLSGEPWYWAWREKTGEDANGNIIWSAWNHRTINVPEENNTPPQLTLLGEEVITLSKGDEFTDSGVTANDAEDGDITDQVTTTYEYAPNAEAEKVPADGIDTSLVGEFTITYSVTDSGGLSAEVSRTVSILPAPKLEFSEEPSFKGAFGNPRGVGREKATAGLDEIIFKVVYEDKNNSSEVPEVFAHVEKHLSFGTLAFEDDVVFSYGYSCVPGRAKNPYFNDEWVMSCSTGDPYTFRGMAAGESINIDIPEYNAQSVTLEIAGYAGIEADVEVSVTDINSNPLGNVQKHLSFSSNPEETQSVTISADPRIVRGIQLKVLQSTEVGLFVKSVILDEKVRMPLDEYAIDPKNSDGDFGNGEQFSLSLRPSKGKYSYFFEAESNGVTVFRKEELFPLTFETGYSSVLFFPGILASRLYKDAESNCDFKTDDNCFDRFWEPTLDDQTSDVIDLYLTSDGSSIREGIYTVDTIDEPLGFDPATNVYKKFLEELNAWKNAGIYNNYQVIPYDWRLPFGEVLNSSDFRDGKLYFDTPDAKYIYRNIEALAATSANGKVTIITHSMGNFMAKKLLMTMDDPSIVENLIMVAAPQIGTPQSIASILHGEDKYLFSFFRDNPDIDDTGIFHTLDASISRNFVRNMITSYVLLPHQKYFDYVTDIKEGEDLGATDVITFDGSLLDMETTDSDIQKMLRYYLYDDQKAPINDYNSYIEFLTGAEGRDQPTNDNVKKPIIVNNEVLQKATAIQEEMTSWIPPTDLNIYQIAGWGKYTVKGIEYHAENEGTISNPKYVLDMRPQETIDGDGTVVLPSAVVLETPGTGDDPYDFKKKEGLQTYFVNIKKYNESNLGTTINRKHANILEIEYLRNLIDKIIKNDSIEIDSDQNLKYISYSRPEFTDKYIRLSVHSPVIISIIDSEGNKTGIIHNPDAPETLLSIVEEIPNSSYMQFGEGKYLYIPADQEYTVELEGLGYGSFTFEIEEKLGDEIIETKVLENIPVSPETKASMTIKTINEASPLSVDVDGDGEEDASISINGNEGEEDVSAEIDIIFSLIGTLEMDQGLKEKLLKKLLLAETRLEKGKADNASKVLKNTIKKLENEIKRNERLVKRDEKQNTRKEKIQGKIEDIMSHLDPEDEEETEEDAEEEKTFKELQKEAKKNNRLQKRLEKLEKLLERKSEKWEEWKEKHPGERISTEDAEMLILLLERIVEKL